MNVLTIDLDYISNNYAKLVDNIYSNDFSNKRWGEFYKNTYTTTSFKKQHTHVRCKKNMG